MTDFVPIRAEIKLLDTEEGGRTVPITSIYRPNHVFFGDISRGAAMGQIWDEGDPPRRPGESFEKTFKVSVWDELVPELYPGKVWRIQEGYKLVGWGKILEVPE